MNYITIARYPGKEYGNEYLDMKDFYGNLFDLVDNVDKYVREHVKEKSIVLEDMIPRKVIPQYPYYAIREIITNAVIHRDYSNQSSRIIIRMFKDRIEFNSPGGLPENVTPENIIYEQSSRNPIIADIFQKVKYIEKMGEGWDKIIDNFKNSEYEVKMPEIIDTKNTVVVKIFSPKEMIEEDISTGHKSDANRTQIRQNVDTNVDTNPLIRQNWIISYLKENKQLKSKLIQSTFKISREIASRDLNYLIEQGKIIKKGAGNNVWYELK